MKLKTYEIQFKCYYGETSDYGCTFIQARDQNAALRKFARQKRLGKVDPGDADNWTWECGVWFERFKFIKEVEIVPCPYCEGKGEVAVDKLHKYLSS